MKNLVIILTLVLTTACQKRIQQVTGKAGSSCSVTSTPTGALISCTDGSFAAINNGVNGNDGATGQNGSNGLSSYDLWLGMGNTGTLGDFLLSLVGANGIPGSQGNTGQNGNNGVSCGVTQLANGALITCGISSAVVLNGSDGIDAMSGMIGIAAILNPCGSTTNHTEVLLKLSTGQVLAVYDGGPHWDRLALLIPGVVYQTTDSHQNQCVFSIDANGNLN